MTTIDILYKAVDVLLSSTKVINNAKTILIFIKALMEKSNQLAGACHVSSTLVKSTCYTTNKTFPEAV